MRRRAAADSWAMIRGAGLRPPTRGARDGNHGERRHGRRPESRDDDVAEPTQRERSRAPTAGAEGKQRRSRQRCRPWQPPRASRRSAIGTSRTRDTARKSPCSVVATQFAAASSHASKGSTRASLGVCSEGTRSRAANSARLAAPGEPQDGAGRRPAKAHLLSASPRARRGSAPG